MRMPLILKFRAGSLVLILGLLASPLALSAEKYLGKTVEVQRKDRGPVTGTVVAEVEGKSIKVRDSKGIVIEIGLKDKDIIGISVKGSPKEKFEADFKKLKDAKDAAGLVQLAKWCGEPSVNLREEKIAALDEALRIDPENAEARALRGFVKGKDGSWVDEEEEKKKEGYVKGPDGKYITKEEAETIEAEKKGIVKGVRGRAKELEGVPWADARVVESAHYVLKCNSTKEVADRYSKILEALYRAYSELMSGFKPQYKEKSKVYVFRNREEFLDFTLAAWAAGYFQPLDKCVRTYHGSFGLNGNTDLILAHEATHQFQHRFIKDFRAAPFWLIEGMAVYFGDGAKVRPEKVELHKIPRDRLQSLQDAIRWGGYRPLKEIFKVTINMPDAVKLPCYDHGWGFIFWCLQGKKYGAPKGEKGPEIWKKYINHVFTELTIPPRTNFMELTKKEADYLIDLILKETGSPSFEKWEEDFKNFILKLPLEPLGEWKGNTMAWEGKEIGIQLKFPDKMKRVDWKELRYRRPYSEAAAATTDDGVRIWLTVTEKPEMESAEFDPGLFLRNMMNLFFSEKAFDEEFKDDETKVIKVNNFYDVGITKFTGKFRRHREPSAQEAPASGEKGGKDEKGAPKAAKKASPGDEKSRKNLPDFAAEHSVRAALFSSADRIFLIVMAGPKGPFSKIEDKFMDVVNSVRLSFGFQGLGK